MITIAGYSADWPAAFEAEAEALRRVLGSVALRIEHVGSTAVPGLAAKPVIDIQVSVASLADPRRFERALHPIAYTFHSLGNIDLVYPFFAKPNGWPETHHVHLCEAGSEQEARHVAFRDLLRQSAALADSYVVLKRCLAAQHDGASLQSREGYSLAKSSFVEAALREGGFNWRLPGPA